MRGRRLKRVICQVCDIWHLFTAQDVLTFGVIKLYRTNDALLCLSFLACLLLQTYVFNLIITHLISISVCIRVGLQIRTYIIFQWKVALADLLNSFNIFIDYNL